MKWNLDTNEINNNAESIIGNLKEESVVVYCFIKNQFDEGNVSENKLLQFVFRSFYRIDNTGLTDDFKNRYFEILQSSKSNNPNLRVICNDLCEIKNQRGFESLQFSFVTKLANTVNSKFPIYDSKVAKMYSYRPLSSAKPIEDRLDSLESFYNFLLSDYSTILKNDSLSLALSEFDKKFEKYKLIDNIKKLDFIVRSAGKLMDECK